MYSLSLLRRKGISWEIPKSKIYSPSLLLLHWISLEERTLWSHSLMAAKLFGEGLSVKHFQVKNEIFLALFLPILKRLIWKLWDTNKPTTTKNSPPNQTKTKLVYLIKVNCWDQIHSLWFIHDIIKYLI